MNDTTIRIDEHDAIRLLREVVVEQGATTVYRVPEQHGTCVYVDNGACSCLIGHVLVRAGVSIEALEDVNYEVVSQLALPTLEMTNGACALLRAAQAVQDVGESWGEAERVAEEVYAAIQGGVDAWGAARRYCRTPA